MPSHERYQYTPLPAPGDDETDVSIRLVKLHLGNLDDQITCELLTCPLLNAPEYEVCDRSQSSIITLWRIDFGAFKRLHACADLTI